MKYPDLQPGDRIGRWVLVNVSHKRRGEAHWNCLCDCGNSKAIAAGSLRRKASRSCGCLNAEMVSQRSTTHGKSNDPIFAIWNAMIQRCHNPNSKQWEDYGGRGIKVCRPWHAFENFYADMGDSPFSGAQLERRNNEKGYSKSNCRWATRSENARNKRNNVWLEHQGQQYSLYDLERMSGVSAKNIYQRIFTYGWSVERAVTEPTQPRSKECTRQRRARAAVVARAVVARSASGVLHEPQLDQMDPHHQPHDAAPDGQADRGAE